MADKNHLGTVEEQIQFAKAMNQELSKHKSEKKPMRRWKLKKAIMENNNPQIQMRIKQINDLIYEYFNELCTAERSAEILNEIKKQSVHIANYSMMTWIKIGQEMQKK